MSFPKTTVVLPISRTAYLRPVSNCLSNLIKPDNTDLLIITDGNQKLNEAVGRRLGSIQFKWIQVINFGESPAKTINDRRYRISAIHNLARQYIKGDFVFCIEDDTVYPTDTLTRFYYKLNGGYSFVQGVQLGRHNTPYIGAWIADDLDSPKLIKSILPSDKLNNIDAGGLYCALIDAELYKEHEFEPFDKQGTNGLSCDVNFGLWLRRQNKKCLIDWSIECDHIGDKGSVNIGNTKPVRVVFEKRNNKWGSRTERIL